jgi:hypothetical protein
MPSGWLKPQYDDLITTATNATSMRLHKTTEKIDISSQRYLTTNLDAQIQNP